MCVNTSCISDSTGLTVKMSCAECGSKQKVRNYHRTGESNSQFRNRQAKATRAHCGNTGQHRHMGQSQSFLSHTTVV